MLVLFSGIFQSTSAKLLSCFIVFYSHKDFWLLKILEMQENSVQKRHIYFIGLNTHMFILLG